MIRYQRVTVCLFYFIVLRQHVFKRDEEEKKNKQEVSTLASSGAPPVLAQLY